MTDTYGEVRDIVVFAIPASKLTEIAEQFPPPLEQSSIGLISIFIYTGHKKQYKLPSSR
jgi:hypothetical protein